MNLEKMKAVFADEAFTSIYLRSFRFQNRKVSGQMHPAKSTIRKYRMPSAR